MLMRYPSWMSRHSQLVSLSHGVRNGIASAIRMFSGFDAIDL